MIHAVIMYYIPITFYGSEHHSKVENNMGVLIGTTY